MKVTFKLIPAVILCSLATFGFAGAAVKPPAEGGVVTRDRSQRTREFRTSAVFRPCREKNIHHTRDKSRGGNY